MVRVRGRRSLRLPDAMVVEKQGENCPESSLEGNRGIWDGLSTKTSAGAVESVRPGA